MDNTYKSIAALVASFEDLQYVDTKLIISNIEGTLLVTSDDLSNFTRLGGGYTNPVFTFDVDGKTYVYRYPGQGTEKFINRKSECIAHQTAKELHLDDSLVWINEAGHKLSKFIADFRYFDYDKSADVTNILNTLRDLHNSDRLCGVKYDIYDDILNFWESDQVYIKSIYPQIDELKAKVFEIYETLNYDQAHLVLCHNDVYTTNILITDEKFLLIDWEFGKDTHRALDLCTFFVCSDYTLEQIDLILVEYLQTDDKELKLEYYKYFIVGAFYWLLWALHVESTGGDTEGFVQKYYKYLKMFINKVDGE